MKRIGHLARKALAASPREWKHRGRQAWFNLRNRAHPLLGSGALPEDGHLASLGLERRALTAWWCERSPPWFLDPARTRALAEWFRAGRLKEIENRAEQVCAGTMPLFSLDPIPFREADRWHRDPWSGRVTPRWVYPRIPYLSPEVVGDNKMVWEPSRFAWSIWLGLAHRVTGTPRYRDKFLELTADWLETNPYPYGIHYCSALEVGFRCYAWLWAAALFAPTLAEQPQLLDRLLHGIWASCRHVEANLSHYFSPNTHLTGEAFCLFACGAAIPEWSESSRWRRLGIQILREEADRQFFRDGTHRELSSGYHLYSTDFYLQACLIADETGFDVGPELRGAARHLCERLAELAPESAVLPPFNDCDGGRIFHLGEAALDATPTLSAAALLWPDFPSRSPEPPTAAGYAMLMAPLATQGIERKARSSGTPSSVVPTETAGDSGVQVYRNQEGDFLVFRATPFGYMGCPHSHDAPLSFLLYLGGRPIVIDCGVGAYNRDLDLRNEFRTARGKNVLLLDGRGPSEPGSWFDWKRTTDASLDAVEVFEGGVRCSGHHTGFSSTYGAPVSVERSIELRDSGLILVTDRWEAPRPVTPSLQLTLAPGLEIDLPARTLCAPDTPPVHFHCRAEPSAAVVSAERVQFSPDYAQIESTTGLSVTLAPCQSGSLVTSLSRSGPI